MAYIAYYRVSTQKQGRSGLGLEAQQAAVQSFVRNDNIIREFTDVEHGDDDYRPQLLLALEMAKKINAILLIAKLDRLSRNVTFISTLMDNNIRFTCCDMPEANELTIHLMAALAQWELKNIRRRIKVALKAKKERIARDGGFNDKNGNWRTKLGNEDNLTGRHLGPVVMRNKATANPNNIKAKAMAALLRDKGLPMHEIAAELNAKGFKASRGGDLNSEQVRRLLNRRAA